VLHESIRPPKAIYRGLFRQVTFRVQISVPRSRRSTLQVQELVEAFRISGLSKAAFSRQHRIAPSCLCRHLKKTPPPDTRPSPKPLRFLEVETPAPPPDSLACRIVFPSGLRFEVPRSFKSDELSGLLRIVSSAGGKPHTSLRELPRVWLPAFFFLKAQSICARASRG
jgi:hypothetical protein